MKRNRKKGSLRGLFGFKDRDTNQHDETNTKKWHSILKGRAKRIKNRKKRKNKKK